MEQNKGKKGPSRQEEFGGLDPKRVEIKKPAIGAPSAAVPSPVKFIAEHTVAAGETLSHIALKYYGSAAKEMWMHIYEANREVIGDNPNRVLPGQVYKIPEKPTK